VRELGPDVWHWEAPHPRWTPGAGWDELVSSYAIDDGERLLLFDPLAVPSEIEGRAAERETAIVLTSPWHERDARSVQERLGARVFVPPRDGAAPTWPGSRPRRDTFSRSAIGYRSESKCSPGSLNDVVFWVESRRTVVAGGHAIDRDEGLEIPVDWLPERVTREQVAEALRPLLALSVEHVLATHGGPSDRAGLERALS
jgi:hypothetical protein